MNVTIDPDMQKFIDEQLRAGAYATPEAIIRAGLAALKQQEVFGDFKCNELDALLATGEQSITQNGTLDAEEALRRRRDRRSSNSTNGQ